MPCPIKATPITSGVWSPGFHNKMEPVQETPEGSSTMYKAVSEQEYPSLH